MKSKHVQSITWLKSREIINLFDSNNDNLVDKMHLFIVLSIVLLPIFLLVNSSDNFKAKPYIVRKPGDPEKCTNKNEHLIPNLEGGLFCSDVDDESKIFDSFSGKKDVSFKLFTDKMPKGSKWIKLDEKEDLITKSFDKSIQTRWNCWLDSTFYR